MPLMQQLLFNVPSFILGLMVVGGTVAFSILGLFLVRRFISHNKLRTHHDVADPMLGALAAIYAVLIAFVVVTVWQGFDESASNVEQEANCLADVYRDSEAFAPGFHQQVGDVLRAYRQAIIEDEWKTMAQGKMSLQAETLIRKLWALYVSYQPQTAAEQSFFDESVRKLNLLRELRRQRIMDSRTGVQPLLWFVLAAGGISTISFTFFFGAENFRAQLGMVTLLAITISLILFTMLSMDFPFTGSVSISPEPFQQILLD